MAHDCCGPEELYIQAITYSSKSVYKCLHGTSIVFRKKPRNGVELLKQLALGRFLARGGWRSGRAGCGHCPTHSHFGREQCSAAQAASAFFVSYAKQEHMPSPERVTIIAFAEEGGDAARYG